LRSIENPLKFDIDLAISLFSSIAPFPTSWEFMGSSRADFYIVEEMTIGFRVAVSSAPKAKFDAKANAKT